MHSEVQFNQGLPWVSSVLEQVMSWNQNSTLHCIRPKVNIIVLPNVALNRVKSKLLLNITEPVQPVSSSHYSIYSTPLGLLLPGGRPRTFAAKNALLFPTLNVVSFSVLHPFSLLSYSVVFRLLTLVRAQSSSRSFYPPK